MSGGVCLKGPSIVNFFDRRCVYYRSYDEDGRIAERKSTFLVLMLVLIRMSYIGRVPILSVCDRIISSWWRKSVSVHGHG